ncbi:MAG TPA: hypothetical protein VF017_18845 [Thermoanaerobaculia bacterium]|nr:hypothetical protein [Thermoanaerobaculia bacterium]
MSWDRVGRRLSRALPPFGPALVVVLGLLVLSCRSPHRGLWRGSFDGTVSGEMEFRISSWGAKLEGSMQGRTREGSPFEADLEGKMRGEAFYARIEGSARGGVLPVAFEGLMRGELGGERGGGDWQVEIKLTREPMAGRWQASRVE